MFQIQQNWWPQKFSTEISVEFIVVVEYPQFVILSIKRSFLPPEFVGLHVCVCVYVYNFMEYYKCT
jgi:hypothetical protein